MYHVTILAPPTMLYLQVNCGTLESLLERLVKVSHYGLDFLNTFLMTFPLYTTAHHILDFLSKSYHDCLSTRERKRSGSITPQDAVRDARGNRTSDRANVNLMYIIVYSLVLDKLILISWYLVQNYFSTDIEKLKFPMNACIL